MRTRIAGGLFVLPDKPAKTGLKPYKQERLPRSDAAWQAVFCGVQLFQGSFWKNKQLLLFQRQPNQTICLVGHEQRNVQYIIIQFEIIKREADAKFYFVREQLFEFL